MRPVLVEDRAVGLGGQRAQLDKFEEVGPFGKSRMRDQ